jgi:hypothetical protein
MADQPTNPSNQRDPDPLPKWTRDDRPTDMFAARRIWYVVLGLLVVMAIVAGLINYWHGDPHPHEPAPREQAVPRTPE